MPIFGIIASGIQGSLNAGSFESIATVTVGSGGQSTITFSSIPSTYTHLQIRYIMRSDSGGYGKITFNSDTTGSNYYTHNLAGGGTSASGTSFAGSSYSAALFEVYGIITNANIFTGGVLDILDYTSTSKNKTFRVLEGYDTNGGGVVEVGSGLWSATPAAINRIDLAISSGAFQQYSQFALYGIKS